MERYYVIKKWYAAMFRDLPVRGNRGILLSMAQIRRDAEIEL